MVRIIGFAFFALITTTQVAAQHYHLNAGATAPSAGTKLVFRNGAEHDTNSNFIVKLQKNATNGFNGDFVGNISMTSLSADPLAPEPGHAAPGAFLQVEVVSVEGPEDGAFSFWDRNIVEGEAIFSVPVGTTYGTNRFALSEGDGSPSSDPFGHIHGRNFSATKAGLYTVGLRLFDTSGNGAGGGPIHEPSDLYYIYFQAGITLDLHVADGKVQVRYPAITGTEWTLQRTVHLEPEGTEWEIADAPTVGDDHLHSYDADATAESYFRIVGTLP